MTHHILCLQILELGLAALALVRVSGGFPLITADGRLLASNGSTLVAPTGEQQQLPGAGHLPCTFPERQGCPSPHLPCAISAPSLHLP